MANTGGGQADAPDKRWQCWECQRRRLVCDSARPICHKCQAAGITCPGYDNKKPLTWLAPGKVVARNRRKKPKPGPKKASSEKRSPESNSPDEGNSLVIRAGPNQPSEPVLFFAHSLTTTSLKTDLCDAMEAAIYYTHHIYPTMMDALLVPESSILPLMDFDFNQIPPLSIHSIVCLALGYRIHNAPRDLDSRTVRHLWSRLYHHRGAAIRILNTDIAGKNTRASDNTISGLVTFLVQEIQQSIDPHWMYHLEGAMELVRIRGGLAKMCRESPTLKCIITLLMMLAVVGNTTTPAASQMNAEMHYDLADEISEVFESGNVAPLLCPKPIFLILIRINRLRFQAASDTPPPRGASRSAAEDLLRDIESFAPKEWAATKETFQEDWTLLGSVYKSTAALYCVCALQSVSVLPATAAVNALRAGYRARQRALLEQGMGARRVFHSLVWPLVVTGVDCVGAGASIAIREFVERSLLALGRDIGSFSPRVAKVTLNRYWESGKSTWDECFDRPYAFLA